MERSSLLYVVLLIGVLCWMSPMAWAQDDPRVRDDGGSGIIDLWMRIVAEEGVDYLVLDLKADNTYALGQHVRPYQIEWLEEGSYAWDEEKKELKMTVTSSTREPERVGSTYTYTDVEVTEQTLSWTDEHGERIEYTRGILFDLPVPVSPCSWGEIKAMFRK